MFSFLSFRSSLRALWLLSLRSSPFSLRPLNALLGLSLLRLSLGLSLLWLTLRLLSLRSLLLSLRLLSLRLSLWLLDSPLRLLSQWLSLLLNLRPLLILLLPLLPQYLLLLWRPRLIALDAPVFLPLPILIRVPALPILLKSLVGNLLIVPPVPLPVMVSVVSSPTRIYIEIELWNMIEVGPTTVVVARAIPTAFPQTPPPAVIEKQVYVYIGNNVDIGRIGQHDHTRRCVKYDGRRQRDSNAYAYLCHCRNRNESYQPHEYRSKK
jgi:hypothetical protein